MFTAPEGASRKARLKVEVPCELVAKSWILPRSVPPERSSGPVKVPEMVPVAALKDNPGGSVPIRVKIVGSEGSALDGAMIVYIKN